MINVGDWDISFLTILFIEPRGGISPKMTVLVYFVGAGKFKVKLSTLGDPAIYIILLLDSFNAQVGLLL